MVNPETPKGNTWLFILLIIALAVLLMLSSCVTEKQRAKICATCPVKDSVSYVEKVEYIRHDTTIYISTSPIINIDTLYCDSLGIIKAFQRTWVKNGIKQSLTIKNNVATIECGADSLKKVIEGLNVEKATIMSEVRTSIRKEVQFIEHWWKWPLLILSGISIIFWLIKLVSLWISTRLPH